MSETEPADETDGENEPDTVTVSEDKFNGTATLQIKAKNERQAEAGARRYFREVHGSDPSKVVLSEDEHRSMMEAETTHYVVMVADHSSGSLNSGAEYTFD